jgi:two-component system sensor histidine kinase/response regulator
MSESQGRVLVVDDNEMNRDLLSRRLKREGYSVVVAEGGAEAIARLAHDDFDLALLDVMMPDVSGLDVLKHVRERSSLAELPVIMVTAKDQSEDVVEALRLGANDYVTKPIDFPVLMARVRTAMHLRRLSELKDEFLRIASHDLKNPLTEVMGIAGLVEALVPPGTPMPERLHGLVGKQKAAAKRMQTIIEDFLDFQAAEAGGLRLQLAPTDLGALAAEIVEACQVAAAAKGIALSVAPSPDVPSVPADRARLSQVVQNLVDNAIKFGSAGDVVVVTTHRTEDVVVLEVSDTGPGLKEDDFARVFSKYGRLSSRPTAGEKSTGLGLAISKQLVQQHHGQIGVRNNPERGATFWLSLPIAGPSAET